MIDVLKIALGVVIAQAIRPVILVAVVVIGQRARGEYWRAPGDSNATHIFNMIKSVY